MPPCFARHCCFSKAQIAQHHLRHAQDLLSAGKQEAALEGPIAMALQLRPCEELAMELKCRALLSLNRFKEIVDLLREHLPDLMQSSPSLVDQNQQRRKRATMETRINGGVGRDEDADADDADSDSDDGLGRRICKKKKKKKKKNRIFAMGCGGRSSNGDGRRSSSRFSSRRHSHGGAGDGREWRYLILGQACYHLGMMEEATILLQIGKRSASDASRRYSNGIGEDDFDCTTGSDHHSHSHSHSHCHHIQNHLHLHRQNRLHLHLPAGNEMGMVSDMILHIKHLLRRRSAAMAALEAGLYEESIRHLSKLVEGSTKKTTKKKKKKMQMQMKNLKMEMEMEMKLASGGTMPPWFLADCFLQRAIGYQAMGKVVDAIADCNRHLALNPRSTQALSVRASLQEMVRNFTECLLDLQQLKMVFEASQWEAMHSMNRSSSSSSSSASSSSSSSSSSLASTASSSSTASSASLASTTASSATSSSSTSSSRSTASSTSASDDDFSSRIEYIASKIAATRRRLRSSPGLDAHMVLDLPADGRSSSTAIITIASVEKAYLLLSLKHSPDKASLFLDTCHGYGGRDLQAAKEEAEASAARLSNLIHKAYTKLLSSIREREKEEESASIADPLFRRARSLHEGGYGGGGRRIMGMEL